MDGNARWAKSKGYDTFMGHRAGLQAFKNTVNSCCSLVPALTVREQLFERTVYVISTSSLSPYQVFAFSSENFRRGEREVAFLMSLFARALKEEGRCGGALKRGSEICPPKSNSLFAGLCTIVVCASGLLENEIVCRPG